MPRIRTIKPEMPHDERLARVSRNTRYHFVLLWTQADDDGYFRATPRLILGQLYPHDRDVGESDVDRMTAELVEIGILDLRTGPDGPIGHIRNWLKHQRIDHPTKSHLAPVFAKASRVSRESLATGVLSLESRSLEQNNSTAPRAKPDAVAPDWLEQITEPTHRDAAVATLADAQRPRDVAASIAALHDGMHGSYTWPIIGRALLELRAAGGAFTPHRLEAFCRKLAAPPGPAPPARLTQREKNIALLDAEIAKERAKQEVA